MTDLRKIFCWLLGHDWNLGYLRRVVLIDGKELPFLAEIWIDCYRCKMRKK